MRKLLLFIFLGVFLFSISLVSSQTTNNQLSAPNLQLNNHTFQAGETILGVITGNFEESIKNEDIIFIQDKREVFLENDLTFYNGTYFFYAYTNNAGEYQIKINNILYRNENNVLDSITLEENISVTNQNTNETALSIKPGFLKLLSTQNSGIIKLENLGNTFLSFSYEFENNEQHITLDKGETKSIDPTPTKPFSYFTISSYKTFKIPIISGKYFSSTPSTPIISSTNQSTDNFPNHPIVQPTNYSNSNPATKPTQTCEDLGGIICSSTQYCDSSETKQALNTAYCCMGGGCVDIFQEVETQKKTNLIIGIVIVLLLLIMGYLVYYKFKKTSTSSSQGAKKEIQKRNQNYEKKFAKR